MKFTQVAQYGPDVDVCIPTAHDSRTLARARQQAAAMLQAATLRAHQRSSRRARRPCRGGRTGSLQSWTRLGEHRAVGRQQGCLGLATRRMCKAAPSTVHLHCWSNHAACTPGAHQEFPSAAYAWPAVGCPLPARPLPPAVSAVVSMPPPWVPVEMNTPAALPTSAPLAHRPPAGEPGKSKGSRLDGMPPALPCRTWALHSQMTGLMLD